ncbi:MAG: hypothetical protein H7Z15_13325 [Rhizobacter sp.]|nr:hypothetical protein [Rhizobacter sp.]
MRPFNRGFATAVFLFVACLLPAAAQQPWDACQMLRQADVEAAFAPRKFDKGSLAKDPVKRTPKMAAVSTCTYVSAGPKPSDVFTVVLTARRAPSDTSGVTPAVAKDGAKKLNVKASPMDVSGLGAGAYWIDLGSKAFPIVELNVFSGPRVWLVFSGGGMKVSPDVAVEGLKKIATATLPRLP